MGRLLFYIDRGSHVKKGKRTRKMGVENHPLPRMIEINQGDQPSKSYQQQYQLYSAVRILFYKLTFTFLTHRGWSI